MSNHACKDCGTELTAENWYTSFQKNRSYVCKTCAGTRRKAPRKAKDAPAASSKSAVAAVLSRFKGDGRASQSQLDWLHARVALALAQNFVQHDQDGTPPSVALIDKTIKFLEKTDSTSPARDKGAPDRLAGLLADYEGDADLDEGAPPETDFRPAAATSSATSLVHPLVKHDDPTAAGSDQAQACSPSVGAVDRHADLLKEYEQATDSAGAPTGPNRWDWQYDRDAQVRLPQLIGPDGKPVRDDE